MSEEKSVKPESVSEHGDAMETETDGKDDNGHVAEPASLTSNNGLPVVKASGSFAARVAWLAVLLAMGGIFTSYYLWNELKRVEREQQQAASELRGLFSQARGGNRQAKDRLSPLENRLSTVEQMLAQVREQSQDQQGVKQELSIISQQFGEDLQRIELRQEGTQSVLKTLQQRQGSDLDTWRLAQVQFLLRVANERLQLQHDPTTATAALVSADIELKELGDPGYLPVREQLAKEIASLKALPWPDASGIAMALTGFAQQVRHLPVKGAETPPPASGGASTEPNNRDDTLDWQQLPNIVWESIRELVQVSRQDEPVGAMLAPKERYFLYQNLQLQLEAARVAVLRRDQKNFRISLRNVSVWLQEHFDTDAAVTQGMMSKVNLLLGIDVQPELPDISRSLHLLRQIMAANVVTFSRDPSTVDTEAKVP